MWKRAKDASISSHDIVYASGISEGKDTPLFFKRHQVKQVMHMELRLTDKKVMVIGASRGIGQATAKLFLAEGSYVAACCRSRNLCEDFNDTDSSRFMFGNAVDATDSTEFKSWYSEAVTRLHGLDHLIWTVSAQCRDLAASFQGEVLPFEHVLELARPTLRASVAPSVIAIGSQAALLALPNYKGYAAAKAALISFCGSAAYELAHEGIRLNVISPGEIVFPGGHWERIRQERPEKYHEALKRTARGRFGTPDEVARLVVFVASPAGSLLSGANILADHAGREFIQF